MDKTLDRLDRLASSPKVATEILELTQDADVDVQQIVDCLQHDPALTASILRMVNSSHYGLSHRIASVPHAVTYMGRNALRLSVLSFGLVDRLVQGAPADLCRTYWRRTLTTATAASQLCTAAGEVRSDEGYCAGLLADLGVLVLAQLHTDCYIELHQGLEHDEELMNAEQDFFGFTHAQLGGRLLERWNFSADVVEAVTNHHREQAGGQGLSLAVHAACVLGEVLWRPDRDRLAEVRRLLRQQFDIDLDRFITLSTNCQEGIAQSAELFGVWPVETFDCQAVLEQARDLWTQQAIKASIELDSVTAVFDQHSA